MTVPLTLHNLKPTTTTTTTTTTITTGNNPNHSKPQQEQPQCLILLEKCTNMSQLKQIHAQMLRTGHINNVYSASRLVAFCALEPTGNLSYARLLLAQIPNPTTFIHNSIIRGLMNVSLYNEALLSYVEMILGGNVVPDKYTYPSLFKACKDIYVGRQIHSHAVKLGFGVDEYIQNTLMQMYSLCRELVAARKLFDKMEGKSVVSWATMIGAYVHCDEPSKAIEVFRKMVEEDVVRPNEVTLVNVLTACARGRDLEMGKWVHMYMEENRFGEDELVVTALLDVYCKCGSYRDARVLFDGMSEKGLFCWNIMINGHVEDGDYEEALVLFREMQVQGVKADKVTMVSLLVASMCIGAVELGKWFHAYIKKECIEVDCVLGTSLVDMYTKCGCVETALEVFQEVRERDVMTWTVMINGLAMGGQGEKALEYFHEMQKSGVKPDAITFVGVLTACSHAGLVEKGYSYFNSMLSVYRIQPSVEHYGCMVDMLGRAGHINQAEKLVQEMPMKPDYFVLGGLLGACKIHGNLDAAERAAKLLLELNPDNGGTYVLLSNIYSSLKKWDDAKRIRELMIQRNIKKPPGSSSIEVGGVIHEFTKGDTSHPQSSEIYEMLDDMICRLKKAGYLPNKSEVLLDIDEEEKEDALCRHSEKLAISFGLISTKPGTSIRVVKNLRVCGDCHSAIKIISLVYKREIIVRDRNRFHHFKDGLCSCKDFW